MALSGAPSLRVVLDRRSIDELQRRLDEAVRAEADGVLRRLSDAAVAYITGLERGLGHETLAGLWDATPVAADGAGWSTEVFSHAEGRKFFNDTTDARTGGRKKSRTHYVEGADLVEYLEYGVAPHRITATDAPELVFPVAAGRKQSDFAGTALTEEGVVAGKYEGEGADDLFVGLSVMHPGFAGNHNIAATAFFLERGLGRAADEGGRRIASRFER